MEPALLNVTKVSKQFGSKKAVDELSFAVRPGEIHALLGANGAGKTTTVRMIIGLTEPDSGNIEFNLGGKGSRRLPAQALGYLPEERGLYLDRSALDSLTYLARLRGANKADARKTALAWLERMELADRANDKLQTLSKGNQQKVQLIAAVAHKPAFIILDEPFSGFDPINQERVIEMLGELRQQGTTILLSAHQLKLVERLADRVTLMNQGTAVLAGTMEEVLAGPQRSRKLTVEWADTITTTDLHIAGVSALKFESRRHASFVLGDAAHLNDVLQELTKLGPVAGIAADKLDLHDVYVKTVGGQR